VSSQKKNQERSYQVQSVARALSLLELLAEYDNGATLTEIAGRLELHPSTVHRILQTMAEYNYVRQDSRKVYHLGLAPLRLGAAVEEQLDIRKLAMDDLRALARQTGEMANLVLPSGNRVVYVAQVNPQTTRGIRMFTRIGAQVPLHCTAVGKCVLADFTEEEMDRFLQESTLSAHTEQTITDPGVLRRELDEVRSQGYAIDDREYDLGVRCVSSPIRDRTGAVAAAIGVSGSSGRITPDRFMDLGALVSDSAERVSRRLGFRLAKEGD
jgi:IclR family acetate operon transcriptional repressor